MRLAGTVEGVGARAPTNLAPAAEARFVRRAQPVGRFTHGMHPRIAGLLLFAVQTTGCAARTTPAATGAPPCEADVATGASPATSEEIAGLAGVYSLILANTISGWVPLGPRPGTLELWPNAPDRRAGWPQRTLGRLPGPRPLVGRVRLVASGGVPAYEAEAVSGSDAPDVEVIGAELYFGAPDGVDAAGTVLRISHVSRDGFWGTWTFHSGIGTVMDSTGRRLENPAGFFCAIRRP